MAANPDREAEYRIYEKETPVLVPWTICCGGKGKNDELQRVGSEDNNFEL